MLHSGQIGHTGQIGHLGHGVGGFEQTFEYNDLVNGLDNGQTNPGQSRGVD